MSALLEIQKEIGVANARVAALEAALRDNPGYPAIAANLESAVRIQDRLQAQFMEIADRIGVEVCRYRAFDDSDRPKAAPVLGAIADFQKLLSVVYGSLKYGRKRHRATIPVEIASETALQFGYAFSGSIGVVLTIRRNAQLFDDSFFDQSVDTIVGLANARKPEEISAFADRLGSGAINALYRWVHDNTDQGLGADVEWRHNGKVRGSLLIQRQELAILKEAIETTSAETSKTRRIPGKLLMADVAALRFKLQVAGSTKTIRGTVEPGVIDAHHAATVPLDYEASIRTTRSFRFAKGTEEVRHHLLKLEPTKGVPK